MIKTTQFDISPGMIDLSVGHPDPNLLPLGLIEKAAQHRLTRGQTSILAYGPEQGDEYFRISLARLLSNQYYHAVDPDQVLVTAGASQGLDLICTLLARPGNTIFVEEPSYFLALRIFKDHHLRIVSLPMDKDGLIPAAVEEALSRKKPAFLYTVPTFHNPSGITMSAKRRGELLALSRKHDFYIVADEVYHMLAFDKRAPLPLACRPGAGKVLSLGSFSKILAPGLRLGWIQGPKETLRVFSACGLIDSGGSLNHFTSTLVRSVIELGLEFDHLALLKNAYLEKGMALYSALKMHLPDSVDFEIPNGGYYIWLTFPKTIDTTRLLKKALKRKVAFLPGIRCSSRKGLKNCARLSYSYWDTIALEKGAERLGMVIEDAL